MNKWEVMEMSYVEKYAEEHIYRKNLNIWEYHMENLYRENMNKYIYVGI